MICKRLQSEPLLQVIKKKSEQDTLAARSVLRQVRYSFLEILLSKSALQPKTCFSVSHDIFHMKAWAESHAAT